MSDIKIETGEYMKNTRYTVPKGTKFVQVILGFEYGSSASVAADRALSLAWQQLRKEFGPDIRHEQVEYRVIFVTCKVLVELQVREV